MKRKFKPEDIDVVILCGGEGKRLRPVVEDLPKPMAKINARPFLDILIDYVASFGFRHFILCTGYKGNLIRQHYNAKKTSLEIILSEEKELLGTAGAIKNAQDYIRSNSFLVMNGDSFCKIDLNEFINFHIKKKALFSVVLSKIQNTKDFGKVILDKSEKITRFSEKINSKSTDNLVNAGIYFLDKTIFSEIPDNKKCSLEYDFFPQIVNKRFYGFVTQKRFIDMGTPEGFKQAEIKLTTISELVK